MVAYQYPRTFNFPLTLPSSVSPNGVELGGSSVVSINRSPFTNQTQTQQWDGDMWTLDLSFSPLKEDQSREFSAFMLALNGAYGTFLFGHPLAKTPRGDYLGSTPLIVESNLTGKVLNTKGWLPNRTVLKAGDYLQVGVRLYMAVGDVVSDGNGFCLIDIFPRIRESPNANAPITLLSPRGIFRLSGNSVNWSADTSRFYDFRLSAVEAL